jgi:hypothetical protein
MDNRLANRRDAARRPRAQAPDMCRTGCNSDPRPYGTPEACLQSATSFMNIERGGDGTGSVVLQRNGCIEQRHHRVADLLVNESAVLDQDRSAHLQECVCHLVGPVGAYSSLSSVNPERSSNSTVRFFTLSGVPQMTQCKAKGT